MILNAPKIKKSRAKNKTVKYSNLNPKENKKEIKIIAKVISEINFDFNNNKLKHKKISKIKKPILGEIQLVSPDKIFFSPAQLKAANKVVTPIMID